MKWSWLGVCVLLSTGCGSVEVTPDAGEVLPEGCDSGLCADGGVVINELAGTGGDFVELFNASDEAVDLGGYGLTDRDADGGIRYATSVRFPTGAVIAARGYFTVFLEKDCPATVTPCLRGEFGLSQGDGDMATFLDPTNATVDQQVYAPNAAPSGSSWARKYDGAPGFEVQPRTPGAPNAK